MKNKWLLPIASVLSVLWIVFVELLFTHNCLDYLKYVLPNDANELGDFLAGVFSPLAFLWLIAGYFLQASELNLTREELSSQTKTLIAQSQAAYKSVELEAENQRESQERREKLAAPLLKLHSANQKSEFPNNLILYISNCRGFLSLAKVKFHENVLFYGLCCQN